MKKVLMICLGNICRSPIAEGVFKDTVQKENTTEEQWDVDSAAIGSWHIGKRPDQRALKTMEDHGLQYDNRARQIEKEDFQKFDYIFGMDEDNIEDLKSIAPKQHKAKILLLGDFGLSKSDKIIRDPYYDRDAKGFEKCYQQCVVACKAFLNEVQNGKI